MKETVILGIESTAHTLGVGIFSNERGILANVRESYTPREGGIHPREAAQHHSAVAGITIKKALEISRISPESIKAVAFSQGPGLGPCLRTGATIARAIASYLDRPLIGVNHCVAHIEISRYTLSVKDPLVLYVSGGNTIITAHEGGRYRVFGETLDIAAGNCLDVFAREIGLRPPGAPALEKTAEKGSNYIKLPYSVKGMDLSFCGLLTMALKKFKEGVNIEDLCYSFQETVFSMLAEVTERALAHTGKSHLLLTGGVAVNKKLQQMLKIVAEEHDAEFLVVPSEYAGDNGAMIALTGYFMYKHNMLLDIDTSFIRQKWRLDAIEVPWFNDVVC